MNSRDPDHGKEPPVYRRILVPIDGSPASAQAVKEAVRLAVVVKGHVRLLHVIDELSISRADYAHDGRAELRSAGAHLLFRSACLVLRADVEVGTVLYEESEGTVASLVADEVKRWHADLVVAGTHGRRGLGQVLLGSSAERIVRGSSVPVMLVHTRANQAEDHSQRTAC